MNLSKKNPTLREWIIRINHECDGRIEKPAWGSSFDNHKPAVTTVGLYWQLLWAKSFLHWIITQSANITEQC